MTNAPIERARATLGGSKPLAGKRVLLTQPSTAAAPLAARLIHAGAAPLWLPTIEVLLPNEEETAALQDAVLRLTDYRMLALLSDVAVDAFVNCALALADNDAKALELMLRASQVEVGAIASGATRLRELGIAATLVPLEHSESGLASAIESLGTVSAGDAVLIPTLRSQPPLTIDESVPALGSVLESRMRALGATVDRMGACALVTPVSTTTDTPEVRLLCSGDVDAVCIGSPEELSSLLALVGGVEGLQEWPVVTAAGQRTLAACEAHGLAVQVPVERGGEPWKMVEGLSKHFAAGKLIW